MFQKATKKQAKLRLLLQGPSGSGKTFSALRMGSELSRRVGSGRVAVIDTESGSASKYADVFDFDVVELSKPYSAEAYLGAINAAVKAQYDVLIVDSLSHAWAGVGGVLDVKEQYAAQRGYNDFTAWKPAKKAHNALVDAILTSPIHIIATARAKTQYVLEEVERGGRTIQQPVKRGMGAVQEGNLEYEFDVVGELDIEHNMIVTKTRCAPLTDRVFAKPGEDVVEILHSWLTDGAPAPAPSPRQRTVEELWAELTEVQRSVFRSANSVAPAIQATVDRYSHANAAANALALFGDLPSGETRADGIARLERFHAVEVYAKLREAGAEQEEAVTAAKQAARDLFSDVAVA